MRHEKSLLPWRSAGLLCAALVLAACDPAALPEADGALRIRELFLQRVSDEVVEAEGRVVVLLRDDNRGSRHQRFIVELPTGDTVLVSHNIDLAARVDALRKGDLVAFRGEYEWNLEGGVVHWTHRDPRGRRPGGWIRHEGEIYR